MSGFRPRYIILEKKNKNRNNNTGKLMKINNVNTKLSDNRSSVIEKTNPLFHTSSKLGENQSSISTVCKIQKMMNNKA